MQKKYLMTPGPTPVPAEVMLKMAAPIIHHRTPDFSAAFKEAIEGLKYVFQTEGDALLTLVTQGSLQAAIFRSDDLDTTFEKVRASGAEVLQEPESQPWGARDCAFRDPSGNLVRIAQA